jgi:HD-GYP domain-containing protein (c-di-GMP phosphodiesterase class II)
MPRFDHKDDLADLDRNVKIGSKIASIHNALKLRFPFVSRIAVALYDVRSDMLQTFLHSSDNANALTHYQAKLSETPLLLDMLLKGRPRVIDDLSIFNDSGQQHTQQIMAQGYLSSYTMSIYERGELLGFLFFNSYERNRFTEEVLEQLDPFGHLIALLIVNELKSMQSLRAAVRTARDFGHFRDDETGSHQDRMSRFALLIAQKIADKYGLSDEYIESVFVFSPLHDIGKIGIPDSILLKPGKLSEEEFGLMQSHTTEGLRLVNQMLGNFCLGETPQIEILRNIAEFHHEALDGSGYPHGHKDEDIPIEARIVAVADIFDALTSRRPYKDAWSNDESFDMLRQLSGSKLDPDCVEALIASQEQVETIQRQFQENILG